jgi:hypothetical protein
MKHLKLFEDFAGWEAPIGSRKLINFEDYYLGSFEINTDERKAIIHFSDNIKSKDVKWFSENENDDLTEEISLAFEKNRNIDKEKSIWDIDINEPVELIDRRSVVICLEKDGESYDDFRIRSNAPDKGNRVGNKYGI